SGQRAVARGRLRPRGGAEGRRAGPADPRLAQRAARARRGRARAGAGRRHAVAAGVVAAAPPAAPRGARGLGLARARPRPARRGGRAGRGLKARALVVFGAADELLPAGASAANIERALVQGGDVDHTVKTFPAANHVLLTLPLVAGGAWDWPRAAPGYLDLVTA